jgi:hypothetical protein
MATEMAGHAGRLYRAYTHVLASQENNPPRTAEVFRALTRREIGPGRKIFFSGQATPSAGSKTRPLMRWTFPILLTLSLVACAKENVPPADAGAPIDGGLERDAGTLPDATPARDAAPDSGDSGLTPDATSDGGDPVDIGPVDTGPMGPPGLRGVLKDENDQPVALAQVLACMATSCLFGESDDEGRFSFEIEPPTEIALKTHEDRDTNPRRAAALYPVRHTTRTLIDMGTVYVPLLPAGAPIGPATSDPQTLMAGDGLELTLRRADLMPVIGDILMDIASRAVPPARRPPLPDLGTEEIVAIYAIHPFGAKSRSPVGVRAPSSLPSGTAVRFRTISELDGLMSMPVTGHADGQFVATDPGVGIDRLTWLVISR